MNIKKQLRLFQSVCENDIAIFLRKEIKNFRKISEFSAFMGENISEYELRGGKRLRAALIYYTYKIYCKDNKQNRAIRSLSSFIELIHTFFLIHDDIMDRDSLRRGGRTMHMTYEEYARKHKILDYKHFGESMAILAGDLAYTLALEKINTSKIPAEKKVRIMEVLTRQLLSTVFGQAHDLLLAYEEVYLEEEIYMVQKYKTAKYTFETPVLLGAILADKNGQEAKILSKFAIPAGIAFQIRDDILGMFGDKKKTGKSANSDIKEGKRTLLILKALENSTPSQVQTIRRFLGKRDLEQDEADQVRKVVRDTGSLDYSIKLTKQYADKALKALDALPNHSSEGWKFLSDVVKYIVVREV